MKLKFCGADKEVTGSSHLVTLEDGYNILLDCGLYQGADDEMDDFNEKWLFDPKKIDCLILSHAHIDHCGRIPKLVKDGFNGIIYCTHATRDIAAIMLMDSAKIQESDAHYQNEKLVKKHKKESKIIKPLYTIEDAQHAMRFFVCFNYEKWFNVHKNVRVLLRDAGHILGSASVTLEITENEKLTTLGFTGDIGRPNRPILKDPVQMPLCDYLISESTYGDRDHVQAPEETEKFIKIIHDTCIINKGRVIIPAFSLGRTQEILYIMDQLYNAGKLPLVPIYLDSPLAINATEVFRVHPECFDDELHKYMLTDSNPFGFNTLQYVKDVDMSKGLNGDHKPCVIISASGMANAGRIRHHIFNNIENPKNTLLFVGFCSAHTLGGIIRSGAKEIKLFGEIKKVNAKIEIMDSFSAHGDRHEMLDFISNQKSSLKKLFLVHGEKETQLRYKAFLQDAGFNNIEIPNLSETIQL
jgi:metallo-beta-lactamase family protein